MLILTASTPTLCHWNIFGSLLVLQLIMLIYIFLAFEFASVYVCIYAGLCFETDK